MARYGREATELLRLGMTHRAERYLGYVAERRRTVKALAPYHRAS